MSLETKSAANYAAQIVSVPKPNKLENSDRLLGLNVLGDVAIVDTSWVQREGELAVYFPAESQISEQYARVNNLFRHSDLNEDPTEVGYFEDNRRVKAIKLRGHVSKALIMPISSLNSFGYKGEFQLGDTFDTINGAEVCRKYVIKEPQQFDREGKKIKATFKRVDVTLMPEHIETDQWLRNEQVVGDDEILIVTQKLHGTSSRFANTIVKRQPTWLEKVLVKIGIAEFV